MLGSFASMDATREIGRIDLGDTCTIWKPLGAISKLSRRSLLRTLLQDDLDGLGEVRRAHTLRMRVPALVPTDACGGHHNYGGHQHPSFGRAAARKLFVRS